MKYVFVGAVEGSLSALNILVDSGIELAGVLTLPLEASARHSDYADLHPICEKNNIPIAEVWKINSPKSIRTLKEMKPDYIIVQGWSQIIGEEVLSIPEKGVIGYHPALLPKYRGRGVIPWVILQNEEKTGISYFLMDDGMDSGPILIQREIKLAEDETARTLYDKIKIETEKGLRELLSGLESGSIVPKEQDHSKATWCAKRTPKDGYINWNWSAKKIWTLIRAVGDPYPPAYTYLNDTKIEILEAEYIVKAPYIGLPGQIQIFKNGKALIACGEGFVNITKIKIDEKTSNAQDGLSKVHETLGISPDAHLPTDKEK